METLIVSLVSVLVTGAGAWGLHRREVAKQKVITEVATTAMHKELDVRMKAHVAFVEERLLAERKWHTYELERERDGCAESINNLAGRLGIAEGELRKLRRVEGNGEQGGGAAT